MFSLYFLQVPIFTTVEFSHCLIVYCDCDLHLILVLGTILGLSFHGLRIGNCEKVRRERGGKEEELAGPVAWRPVGFPCWRPFRGLCFRLPTTAVLVHSRLGSSCGRFLAGPTRRVSINTGDSICHRELWRVCGTEEEAESVAIFVSQRGIWPGKQSQRKHKAREKESNLKS